MAVLFALLALVFGALFTFAVIRFAVRTSRTSDTGSVSARPRVYRAFGGRKETARRLRQLERGIIHLN